VLQAAHIKPLPSGGEHRLDDITQRPRAWREAVEVVAMDGFTGFKTAACAFTRPPAAPRP
jgi:hypothetical protein